jgi:GPH family glycoside/pentoside/hexuronide:cation symporter
MTSADANLATDSTRGRASAATGDISVTTEQDRVPFRAKLAYAVGGTTDIFGHWLYNNLASPVFNVFLGLSPTQVSLGTGTARLVDAFTDPLFGWLSDNTRSRWGRRRPYVLFGSILSGLALPCMFMASPSWSPSAILAFVIISAIVYAPIISSYNMPYQSLGAELTPEYHERTSVMSWKAATQKIAGMLVGYGVWFATRSWFADPATGRPNVARGAVWAGAICGAIMIVSGLFSFAFVRERYYAKAQSQVRVGFLAMFRDTFGCKPYLALLVIALVYAVPSGFAGGLNFYVVTYYVFSGDMTDAGGILGAGGVAYGACGLAGIPVAAWLSRRLGKPKALTVVLLAGLAGFGSAWWLYTPEAAWLTVVCSGFNGMAATGLWVILPSMCADVVDFDELSSHQRREGAYASTFSWTLKLGWSASALAVGPLLQWTGFDATLPQSAYTLRAMRVLFAVTPVVALLIAVVSVQFFPLTQERMVEIRAELEARRGAV